MEVIKRHVARGLLFALALSLALVPAVPRMAGAAQAPGASRVQGPQADGATFNAFPVPFAGVDGSGNVQAVLTDTSGRVVLGTSATAQQVEGEVASGGSATGVNPVLVGGSDGTNVVNVRVLTPADDASPASGWVVNAFGSCWDGTNWDRLKTAGAANGGSGAGVLGVSPMWFDGSNWFRTNGSASNADGQSGTNGAPFVRGYGYVFNGSTWDRARSTGTVGTAAVGNWMVEVSDSSAVQAAAYAANDLVGGKRTFANAVRASGGTGIIRGVTIIDQAANSAANSVYDLIIFNSDPSGTTFTDNSPLDVADTDMSKVVAVIRVDGAQTSIHEQTGGKVQLFTNVDNNALFKSVEVPYVASGTTSLFAALIARGAPTYAATTDVIVKLQMEQD